MVEKKMLKAVSRLLTEGKLSLFPAGVMDPLDFCSGHEHPTTTIALVPTNWLSGSPTLGVLQ